MPRALHAKNPARIKADLNALAASGPPDMFQRLLAIHRRAGVVLLGLLSVTLLSVSFAPFNAWFLAYVALVPWGLLLAAPGGRRALVAGWLTGLLFWALNLYWLWWVTLVGYFAVILYLSAYWFVAAVLVRAAFRRNWPLWLVLPCAWVALEFARNYVISGFPWFFLAHSQYARTALIQIADFGGQYAVSFLVAMVNGVILELLLRPPFFGPKAGRPPLGRTILGPIVTAAAVGAALAYGAYRLGQQTTQPGPVLGVVQQAFPNSLQGRGVPEEEVLQAHLQASEAFLGKDCDLVIWPETMLPAGLNKEITADDGKGRSESYRQFLDEKRRQAREVGSLSRRLRCPILAGGVTLWTNPRPIDGHDGLLARNSALWFDRDWRNSQQVYSKIHLVPFSEYVPFKDSWLDLYRALRWFVPDVMAQLDPGRQYSSFRLTKSPSSAAAPRGEWLLATPICYEGVFDYECRRLVAQGGRKADILVNLSNDGWFYWQWAAHSSTEYAQHLAQYCFRAVETRVPVVRAVNTGISALVDANGRILIQIGGGGVGGAGKEFRPMVAGTLVLEGDRRSDGEYPPGHGPRILVDSRRTVYSQVGDVFAILVSLAGAAIAGGLVLRAYPGRKKEGAAK